MHIKVFLRLTAVVTFVIGLTLAVDPGFVENFFVSVPSHGGDIFIRFLGSSLIGYTYLNWYTSGLDHILDMRATLIGNLSTLTVAFFMSLFAVMSGTLNSKGWLIVLLHLTFGVGFGFYTYEIRHSLKDATGKHRL
jgi:hypothetical protein